MLNIISYCIAWLVNIFTLQFQDSQGNTINMNSFPNKKILLVNIATNSPRVNQLAGLQQLQQQYADSLVVIAFPSNSFGNESRSDAEIKQYCQGNYGTTYIIAAKSPVTGTGMNALYTWLSRSADNGDMNLNIGGDFQKVLIGKDGSILGVFSPKIDPTNQEITDAVTGQ